MENATGGQIFFLWKKKRSAYAVFRGQTRGVIHQGAALLREEDDPDPDIAVAKEQDLTFAGRPVDADGPADHDGLAGAAVQLILGQTARDLDQRLLTIKGEPAIDKTFVFRAVRQFPTAIPGVKRQILIISAGYAQYLDLPTIMCYIM